MSDFFDLGVLYNAITLGAIYALIAVGYTMVYGIIKLINFAHGEVIMLGVFFCWLVAWGAVGLSGGEVAEPGFLLQFALPIGLIVAMLACVLVGVVLDFAAYLPLRRMHRIPDAISVGGLVTFSVLTIVYFVLAKDLRPTDAVPAHLWVLRVLLTITPIVMFATAILGLAGKTGRPEATVASDRLSALITAIGMSLALQTIAQLIWGSDDVYFPPEAVPGFLSDPVPGLSHGDDRLLWKEFVIWIAAVVLMLGLNFLVAYTKIGKAMRACALDKDTAALMGVNVNQVIAVTFMIGSAMAAIAGILFAIKRGGTFNFRFGYSPGIIAFAAAVLGGIGNIRGALVGGLVIGASQAIAQVWAPAYDLAFGFALMIAVILFRPWGLLGKPEAKRA